MKEENKKYFRVSLAEIETKLKEILNEKNELYDELADKLTKRIDNKIDLLSKSIGRYVYEIIGHGGELKGSFIDKDLRPVEWVLTIYDYGVAYGHVANLSFHGQGQDFNAWARADKSGVQVSKAVEGKLSLKDIRQYYDHLNIWVDKFIHTGDLVEILGQIHSEKLNKEVDMLDDDDLE